MPTARVTPTPAQTLSEEVKYTQGKNAPLGHRPPPPVPPLLSLCSFLTSRSTSPLIPCSPTFYQIQSPKQDWTSEMQLRSRSRRKHRQSKWPSLPLKGTVALSEGPVLGRDPVSGRTSVKGSSAPRLPWGSNQFPRPPEAGKRSRNLAAHGRRLDASPSEGSPWMCPLSEVGSKGERWQS